MHVIVLVPRAEQCDFMKCFFLYHGMCLKIVKTGKKNIFEARPKYADTANESSPSHEAGLFDNELLANVEVEHIHVL